MDEDDLPYCIETHFQVGVPETDDVRVRRAVASVLRAEGCPSAEVSVALLDASAVSALNAQYLGRQVETDVLAFDLTDAVRVSDDRRSERCPPLQGEVVVNVELARRLAAERGVDPEAELMLYVVHGCLHLLGYDDGEADEAARMHRREDELLVQMGYGKVYHAPGRQDRDEP